MCAPEEEPGLDRNQCIWKYWVCTALKCCWTLCCEQGEPCDRDVQTLQLVGTELSKLQLTCFKGSQHVARDYRGYHEIKS